MTTKTMTTNARAQRNRALKQRATAASLGVMLGAFGLIAATLPAGSGVGPGAASTPIEQPPALSAPAEVSATTPRAAQPVRRVRTRQS